MYTTDDAQHSPIAQSAIMIGCKHMTLIINT